MHLAILTTETLTDLKTDLVLENNKKECYEEEVQPYQKTDYKPMIYIEMGVSQSIFKVIRYEVIRFPR